MAEKRTGPPGSGRSTDRTALVRGLRRLKKIRDEEEKHLKRAGKQLERLNDPGTGIRMVKGRRQSESLDWKEIIWRACQASANAMDSRMETFVLSLEADVDVYMFVFGSLVVDERRVSWLCDLGRSETHRQRKCVEAAVETCNGQRRPFVICFELGWTPADSAVSRLPDFRSLL